MCTRIYLFTVQFRVQSMKPDINYFLFIQNMVTHPINVLCCLFVIRKYISLLVLVIKANRYHAYEQINKETLLSM